MDAARVLQSYFSVSAAALMIFDYSITLQREVDLLWPTRWSLVKFLFFITRYLPFVDMSLDLYYQVAPHMTPQSCLVTFVLSRWILAFGITGSETILLIRTWTIWDKKKSILITVIITGVCAFISLIVSFIIWTNSLIFGVPVPQPSGCALPVGSFIVGLPLMSVVVVEMIVLGLTIARMVKQVRSTGKYILNISVVRVLYRDALLFPSYLLVISIVNFFVLTVGPAMSRDLLVVLQRVLHSSLTTRMLLNLREALNREHEAEKRGLLTSVA